MTLSPRLLPLAVLGLVPALLSGAPAPEPQSPPPVRLAVIMAVDQLRADYLVRFRPHFVAGGFRRLLEEGADFQNSHHRHGVTATAPGHATISTGVHANIHGVIGNEWLDREAWEQINSVEDPAAPLVGIEPAAFGPAALARPEKTGRSPRNLRATAVADQLKLRFGARSKVFAASNKDRSAILLGGKLADAAYWDEFGRMVTSRYYRDALPDWVAAHNAEKRVEAYFGETWERLLDPAVYDAVQGPDDAPGETVDFGYTRTFPKRVTGGRDAVSPSYYTAFDNSPFSAEVLGAFVQRALREENLGRHEATDLLCVSFSNIDSIGHSYGPDSHEVMDAVLRLDRVIAALLDAIDSHIGLANCVIVLTADHGAAPMPERVQALRPAIPAARIRLADADEAANQALTAAFGPLAAGEYWFTRDGYGYHLRPATLAAKKLTAEQVAQVMKPAIARVPFVAHVFTRGEILGLSDEGEGLAAAVRRGYHAPHDRDLVFVAKPYFMSKAPTGTTHGAPYDYDSHVPQVWFGRGVPRGVHVERVGTDSIAPTLAGLLGIPPPPEAKAPRLF